jgi:hypothetical protein
MKHDVATALGPVSLSSADIVGRLTRQLSRFAVSTGGVSHRRRKKRSIWISIHRLFLSQPATTLRTLEDMALLSRLWRLSPWAYWQASLKVCQKRS